MDSFGDNDRLSAIVAALIGADLLILLSDIDGLYTDDPRENPEAGFISLVPEITPEFLRMGKDTSGSDVGTGECRPSWQRPGLPRTAEPIWS